LRRAAFPFATRRKIFRQTAIWYLNNNVLLGHAFGPTLSPAGA